MSKNYFLSRFSLIETLIYLLSFMQNINELVPSRSGYNSIMLMSISICFGAFVFSYNTVCLTQIAELLKIKNNLSKQQLIYQLSIATSCFNLGAFLSPILYRKYVSIFGELRGLLIIDLIGILAIIAQLIELQFYVLASARFVMGFVIGISTAIIPVYINSVAPPTMVGKLGAFNQVLQTFGVVFAYLAGYIIIQDKEDQIRWRLLLGFPLIFLILRIISLQFFFRFQTLQRHIHKNENQKIKEYCRLVYANESQQIVQKVIQIKSFKKASKENRQTFRTRFIIALVVIASNQLSGVNSILYYAKQLFNKVTDNNQEYTQTLIVLLSLMQVLATMISTEVVDKVGRKNMILKGQTLILVFLLIVSFFDKIIIPHFWQFGTIGIIFFIFAHIMIMNLTLGPCCIIYCTEIVEDITWMIITLKGLSLSIALTTQYMIEYIGLGFMFLIFFGLTLVAHLYLRPRMKETKGLSSSEIYESFGIKNKQTPITQMSAEDENLIK